MPAAWRAMASTHRRHLLGAAAVLVVALAVSSCGGGSTKAATVATTTSTTDRGGPNNQAFAQCMQSHGVNITGLRGVRGGTTPSSLPPGVTAQQFQVAFQACRSQLPAGGQGGQNQNNPAFAAYRNCLQLHGVTLGTNPGGGQGPGGLDRTNPTVQAALQACAALRPAPPGGSTTTPTS